MGAFRPPYNPPEKNKEKAKTWIPDKKFPE